MLISRMLLVVVLLPMLSSWAKSYDRDPFKTMSFHELDNGMKIVLAPNQNSKKVRLKLNVGFGRYAEDDNNLQSGHVLEHMLFKDGNIEDNKSYLEVIREAGGDVNAYVTNDHTSYHTTIAADKADWLISKFRTMLFSRKLTEHELKLGKASVILEIGKPFILNRWLGANPFGYIGANYFPEKSFDENEFGKVSYKFSRENERLSVNRLKLSQIKDVYNNYYYPENMTILMSGKFDAEKMLKNLQLHFGDVESRKGLVMPEFKAKFRGEEFHKVRPSITGDSASIFYGTKLFNRSLEELLTLDAYLNYTAHRLMIELRNKKGETYTAYSSINYTHDSGYSYVSFSTQPEKYEANKKLLIGMVSNEAINGNFSDEEIKNAVDLFLKDRYETTDVDADGIMKLAELYLEVKEDFGEDRTPYEIISSMSPKDFRKNLQTIFKEDKRYIYETTPPLFFSYDTMALIFGSLMLFIFLFRQIWHNKTEVGVTKWVSKASLTPGVIPEILTILFLGFVIDYFTTRPLEYLYEDTQIYRSSLILSTYLPILFGMLSMTGLTMWLMSKLPSKVLFDGKSLIIQSFILKQEEVSLEAIKEIRVLKPMSKYHLKYLLGSKFGLISCFIDCYLWRSSAVIELKNGQTYLLNMKDAKNFKDLVNAELVFVDEVNQEAA